MSFYSNVAPRRRVREKPPDWSCQCVESRLPDDETIRREPRAIRTMSWRSQPGYIVRCSDCGERRP